MAYGTIKVDTVTFTNDGVDKSVTLSGLVQNPTFSGNVTVTGTLSGVTVTGTTANFTSGNFTNISGGTHTITSGVFAAGSAASPSITFTGDLNTGIYSPGADQVAISTGGSPRVTVTSTGVGIGTTSPSQLLHVASALTTGGATPVTWSRSGGATGYLLVDGSGAGIYSGGAFSDSGIYLVPNDRVSFSVNGSERFRCDSSGRLLVGTSSARSTGTLGTNYQALIEKAGDYAGFSVFGNKANNQGSYFVLGKSRGTTAGAVNAVAADDVLGYIGFEGTDGTSSIRAADIFVAVDGTPGANDMPGRLVFSTTADGASSPTERLRIDSSGRVGVGTTSPGAELNIVKNLSGGLGAQLIVENQFGNAGSEAAILCRTNLACKAGLHVVADDGGTGTGNGNYLYFTTTPGGSTTESERARIDGSGRLLVGTSSARTNFYNSTLTSLFQVENASGTRLTSFTYGEVGNSGPIHVFAKHRSASVGGVTIVADGDNLGTLSFQGSDGTEFVPGAEITAQVDGTPGANDMPGRLVFSTTADGASSPTERLRIDSSGRVGIGSSSPGATLNVIGNAWFQDSASSGAIVNIRGLSDKALVDTNTYGAAMPLVFGISGTERARIDSSGRLLVGTSSSPSNAQGSLSKLIVQGYVGADTEVGIVSIQRGEAATSITADEAIGQLAFNSSDGGTFAHIQASADGAAGNNDYPGRLVFSTTADGASSPTERMRITNDGQTYFGITGNTGLGTTNRGLLIRNEIAGKTYVQLASTGTTTDTVFYFYNGNGLVGSISMNGSATAYNTSSDYRLKENVAPVPDGIARLQQLKPSRFNFIADPATTVDGFIAHEIQAVVPEAITGEKDAVDDDGNPIYQGIDQSKLVPLLTAALQEAIGEIESLKARVAALESA